MLGSTPISSDQRHLQEPGDRRRAWPRCGLLLLAGFATVGLTAAADPEIIRLRVPAQDVSRWFPPGTELRRLSADEFDALVAAMGREQARRRSDLPPRLISARHRARWDSGMLTGRTELVFAARAAGPSEYLLESWTPTILATSQPTRVLGARDSGQATLWLDPSPREQTLVLEWELRARPGSRGRGFRLGLPGKETTVLELELPKGWVASSERGVRCGPLPAADPARSRWELDGRSGRFDLEVRDPSDQKVSPVGAGAWVSGPTEIDLRRRTGRTRDLVNWTADWQLERDPRHPARLDLELDPGLELIEVQGPAVRGYRVLESGPAPRVRVELVGTAPASSTVRLLAHAQVPPEGAWRIPAVRPLDATWMGGRTSVVLDESHLVRDCRVNAGRLISPSRPEAGPGHRLVFEANAPRSVAELVFVQPRTEVSCTVRGQLVLAAAPARLTCRLDWTRHRGSRPELEIDLSPGWIPEQVQVEGLDDPVAWHSALRSSEATRLRVILPATVLAKRQWTLNLTASATAREGRGPLELPRVRAVGAATVDEAWLAWVDEGTVIQPAQARGLAWIDPGEVPGLLGHAPGPNWREALAWRWIAPKAEARLDRHRIDQQPRVAIRTLARIGPAGHGLVLEGTLRIRSGTAPVDAIPIWVNQPAASLASWHFREDDVELALAPIDGSARSRLGLPESGAAWRLPVALPGLAEKAIQFRATLPWSSPGSVPLLGVPRGALMRGTILVETPTGMSSQARASGLTRLNASVVDPPRTERDPDPESGRGDRASPRNRIVHAFSYADADARLELATEPLSPRPVPGLLREAVLTTSGDAAGRALHHLSLLVQLEPAQSLDLVMPPRSSLVRVRRDGSAVAPIGSDTRLSFPAGGAGQGARSSSIVLDYVTEGAGLADGVLCRPELPAINVPCLSFVWEIVTPPGWQAVDCGPGLIANDRVDPTDWPSGALGLWKPAWDFVLGRSAADEIERFRQLDDRLAPAAADEWTLAEWFGRWDSGPWPVIIDRLALRTAGLGPKTPCLTGRARAESPSRSLTMLQQHGLVLAPFSRVLLITTAAESSRFSRPSQWTEAIDETLAWGCDRTDRFQTLARWRGETSPRSPAVIGDEAGDRIELLPGRSLWRFSAASWPGDDAYVHLIEVRRRILAGWIVVGLLGWAWLTTGRRLSRGRLFVPAAVAVACVWLDRVVPARWSSGTAAGFTGALAILIVELGLRAGPGPRATGQANGSRLRRAGTSIVGAALLLAMAGLLATRAAAQPEAGSPILALFPYERLSDPDRPTDPVILRLSDFTELSHRAVGAIAQPPAAVTASSAVHRVVRRAAHDVLVESQFELTARGSAPWSWRVPVSLARDLEATLDGKDVPIAIAAGATQARIAIAAAGSHVLHLRRRAATTVDESGSEVLRLPVNASPTAQVIVEPPRDGTPQGELTARGRTEIQPDGTLVGRLGPADQVVIRWARPGAPAAPPAAGSVEGLVLWDVTPAGDRIRARWTVLQPQEIATVRIAHDPGLVLRSVHAPGLVDVVAEEQAGQPRWLLSINPPLRAGSTLTIDCWRPWEAVRGDADADRASRRWAGGLIRRLPQLQPLGMERFTGILGVRRPGDWTGRLEPLPDTEAINDESFVAAWGDLPNEPLTLCGTSRFTRELRAALRTGPSPRRIQVRPTVQLQIESGRIALTADADLIEPSGELPFVAAQLPAGIQITEVTGEGLADWTVSADHRLGLIWDRVGSVRRRWVRIAGWIPLGLDPLRIDTRQRRVPTPWIGWDGAEENSGSLTIAANANAKLELRGATGLTPAPPGSIATAGSAPAGSRLAFRVDDPRRLGEILWEAPPPRTYVEIESQITLNPDSAQWLAVLRYDVAGGALDAIRLRMPAAWAAVAQLQRAGEDYQVTTRVDGPSAFWLVTPRHPLWGSHRIVLQSTVPIAADGEVVYPNVAPLGLGTVNVSLRIVNATGHPLTFEGSTGLQPIPSASRFHAQEFAWDAGTPERAFQVLRENWALRVQVPRSPAEANGSRHDAARVAFADLTLAVLPDSGLLGRGVFETVPESGRLLPVRLPPGSSLLWASVDANAAVPLRSAPEDWSIVLDDRRRERISLIWKSPAVPLSPTRPGEWSIALPRVGAAPVPTLVTVATPAHVTIEGISGVVEPSTMAGLELARADGMARSIRDVLPRIDRSSGRDHERLVALLVNFELALRSAQRSSRGSATVPAGSPGDRAKPDLQRVPMARRAVVEALESAGLAEDLASAQQYLGQRPGRPARPPSGLLDPSTIGRIHALGRRTAFQGITTGTQEPAPPNLVTLAAHPVEVAPDLSFARLAVLASLLLGAAILATWLGDYRGIYPAALAVVLGTAAFAAGPVMLAGGFALAAAAWRNGRAPR